MAERGVGRSLAMGLSLANLWFVGVWSDLLPFLYLSDSFPVGGLPCWNDFAAAVLNVGSFGAAFAVVVALSTRESPAGVGAGWLLLASLAVPLNAIRNHFHVPGEEAFASLDRGAAAAVLGLAVLAVALVAVRWRRKAIAVLHASLLIMFPLAPLMFAQAAWAVSQAGDRMQCSGPADLASPLPGDAARRVVLIVYDELEQRAAFEQRPADLKLPAFDALRAESLAASSMVAPAGRTERSMPAVLTGLLVSDAVLSARNRLELQLQDTRRTVVFDDADTVFSRARGLGINSGLAGFFLPYCSLIPASLTTCTWQPCVTCGRLVGAFGSSVAESMGNQVSELAPRYGPRRHLQAYRALQQEALDLIGDPMLGLVLIHLNVPHDPTVYDRRRGAFSVRPSGPPGYFDNLALADRSLGELRTALARSGVGGRTTLVVFGDHARRSRDEGMTISDPRVPFLVRLPGQESGIAYDAPLNLVLVADLTMDLLAGRIQTASELVRWLDSRTP